MATSISWPELLELDEPEELELLELEELLDDELELDELLEEELELDELLPSVGGVSAGPLCPPQLAMAETQHNNKTRTDGAQ